jgi:hypothetical protein
MGVIALCTASSRRTCVIRSVSRTQSLQHANVRIHFGKVGEWLAASPR